MSDSAPFVTHRSRAKSIAVLGDIYSILATGENTYGQYTLFHTVVFPGNGPPPHVHRREDGFFYILEGELPLLLMAKKPWELLALFFIFPGAACSNSRTKEVKMPRC